jgi:hypothetical protein
MENTRVTDYPSNPNYGLYLYIGDYFSIAATDEEVYVSWTDTRLGRPYSPNMKIGFARTRHIPLPSILVSPPSGHAGQEITIMGENFIPNGEVYIRVGDAYLSAIRSDRDGRFQSKIFMPILGEGPYKIEVIDASGNRAETYFYCELGIDTLEKSIDLMKKEFDKIIGKTTPGNISSPADKSYEEVLKSLRILEDKIEKLESESSYMKNVSYLLLTLLAILCIVVSMYIRRKRLKLQSSYYREHSTILGLRTSSYPSKSPVGRLHPNHYSSNTVQALLSQPQQSLPPEQLPCFQEHP